MKREEVSQILHDEKMMPRLLRAVDLLLGGLAHEERARLRWQLGVVLAGADERVARAALDDQARRWRLIARNQTASAVQQREAVAKLDRVHVVVAVAAGQ